MVTFIESYFFFTIFLLIYNTIRDLRTQEIDSRWNFMASGSVVMLIAYFQPSLINILIPLIVTSITLFVYSFKKFFASGDIEGMSWVMFSLGLFNYWKMVIFLILITSFYIFNYIILKIMKSKSNRVCGYPMIVGSYLITLLTFFFG